MQFYQESKGVFSFTMTVLIYLRNKIITFRYPERAKQSLHHTNVYVPASVAALLEVKPQLIAPATVAFCDRDLIDSKVIKIGIIQGNFSYRFSCRRAGR